MRELQNSIVLSRTIRHALNASASVTQIDVSRVGYDLTSARTRRAHQSAPPPNGQSITEQRVCVVNANFRNSSSEAAFVRQVNCTWAERGTYVGGGFLFRFEFGVRFGELFLSSVKFGFDLLDLLLQAVAFLLGLQETSVGEAAGRRRARTALSLSSRSFCFCSAWSARSAAFSFSIFIDCIFFLMESIVAVVLAFEAMSSGLRARKVKEEEQRSATNERRFCIQG